ncbi:4-hydroxy-tetrahydrodipicolinate reductase [Rickettsiella endosymbiont of Xylota segnis]|uniref:4-hydroxy-tetrahydrodipicolinate reductase n=1 Tax=Rickettsiella endosymbiont of Xylota segnis TaxID=3066238 RepID=UPI0030D3C971
MSIRVLVNGAAGRMGQTTVKFIHADKTLDLVGETYGKDDLKKSILAAKADIVIDFTNAAVVYENTKNIILAGAHPVIGTSGLLPEQIQEFQNLCAEKSLGGIIAPNFCIGALLMMRFAEKAAQYFSECEIIETHHENKLDAPSATAIKTAELISFARKKQPSPKKIHETLVGARGAVKDQIPIHALRLPGFLAKQDVIFGHLGGNLVIAHETIDRNAFMPGVLLACKKVISLKKLVYGLETFL